MIELNPFLPFEYLNFAEQFHNAFHELAERHPTASWPRYFLLCHSIELALKAHLLLRGASPEERWDGVPPVRGMRCRSSISTSLHKQFLVM
jgi:hypothetical protein